MTGAARTQTEREERLLTAYIARHGEELGAFWRDEIEERARSGELQPDDYYWHEGMSEWVRLRDLLGPTPWVPPAAPPSIRTKLLIGGAIAAGFILAALIAIYFVTRREGAPPVRGTAFRQQESSGTIDLEKERELREKAAGELRARIERLPERAAAPLNVFYYDISLNLRQSVLPQTPFQALIRGSENVVDPANDQTIRRTEFTLQTDYRAGEWVFTHYKSTTRNLTDAGQSEEEIDARTMAPPLVVTLLGLKIEPPDPERH